MKKYLIIGIFILITFTNSIALFKQSKGTTQLQFLKIPIGARATGMAATNISNGDDIVSNSYNPANSIFSNLENEVTVQYNFWILKAKFHTLLLSKCYFGIYRQRHAP